MHIRREPPDRAARPVATAAVVVVLLAALAWPARADDAADGPRRPFPSRAEVAAGARRSSAPPGSSGSWWLGTACVALALAACGWGSVAARRFRTGSVAGAAGLKVVGRTNLSPRHVVYLLRAGDRVLIVGTGPQGAPSLLGELEADEPPPPSAPRGRAPARDEAGPFNPPGRLDLRLGDDA